VRGLDHRLSQDFRIGRWDRWSRAAPSAQARPYPGYASRSSPQPHASSRPAPAPVWAEANGREAARAWVVQRVVQRLFRTFLDGGSTGFL